MKYTYKLMVKETKPIWIMSIIVCFCENYMCMCMMQRVAQNTNSSTTYLSMKVMEPSVPLEIDSI